MSSGISTHNTQRPNVLFILSDDQGYGDISIHGNPRLRTPNLDRLAAGGVRFDRFYVHPYCSPTRAALLTGRWPLRTSCHGVTDKASTMRSEEVTLAEALKTAGYRTACFGKWHNGSQFPFTAQGQGFDTFFGFNGGHINHYFDAVLQRGAKPEKTAGFITDVLTDEALRFVESNRTAPFFCYVAYNAPHLPFQVPDRYFEHFKNQGLDDSLAAFYGMCENIDENIGRLLNRLDALGIADNTIVLFATDNGGTGGVASFNAGMRGAKSQVHEGGSRVPLFVRWPAARWPLRVVRSLAAHIDIYPTVLELCGVTAPPGPPVDGISLRRLLEGQGEDEPDQRVLFTYSALSEHEQSPGGIAVAGAVRTSRFRLVREKPNPAQPKTATDWQLYDMDADPGERNDIASKEPGLVAKLSGLYERWYADISSRGLGKFPIQVGHDQENPVEMHATQSDFEGLQYGNTGFSGGWLTGWRKTSAKISFEIDAVKEGEYTVEIKYLCPQSQAGSRIRAWVADSSAEADVPGTEVREISLPHRGQAFRTFTNMEWFTLRVGVLKLKQGRHRLNLQAIHKPGDQVMDFKSAILTRDAPGIVHLSSDFPRIHDIRHE